MNILLVESSFSSLNPSLSRDLTNSAVSLIRLVTSATFKIPPSLRTLWASVKKSTRLVPINERQKTATSTLAGLKGTFAISHAVTNLFLATRSNECTVWNTLGNCCFSTTKICNHIGYWSFLQPFYDFVNRINWP